MKRNGTPHTVVYALAAALLATTGIVSITAAQAQQLAQREFTFNIPSKSVPQAVNDIGRVTGLSVVFPETRPIAARSRPVHGSMTAGQALTTLLAGTGLSYRFSNATTVMIVDPSAQAAGGALPAGAISLDTIDVQGAGNPNSTMTPMPAYAGGQVATGGQVGMLGNRSVMNTPFNQTSYTAKLIQDQQARSIADIAANDPSVRGAWSGSSYTDPLIIRGFESSNQDVALNGLYVVAPQYAISPEFAERVEILKGPSALLYGVPALGGSIGGTINIVPKRATDEPITQFTPSFSSKAQFGGHLDVGRRYGPAKEFGLRFNGVYRNGDTPVDRQSKEVASSFLGLDYRGERTRLSVDLGYQKQNTDAPVRPTYLAVGVPMPTAPKATNNWSQPWQYANTEDRFGALRGEFDLSSSWTVFGGLGGRYSTGEHLYPFTNNITNAAGDLTSTTRFLPEYAKSNTQEIGIRGLFSTGMVDHGLTVSASRSFVETAFDPTTVGTTIMSNIYNPVLAPPFVVPASIAGRSARKTGEKENTGAAIADVLSIFDERVQFIAGLRQQYVRSKSFNPATGGETASYDKSALSPAFGLILKPWKNVSFYGNYIEGLQEGIIVGPTFANAGEIFPPYVTVQKEVGVKVDWGKLTTTLSLFEIARPSVITIPGTPLNSQKVDGEIRNRGLELNAFGEIVDNVRVLGGVAFFDAVQTKTANGINDGKAARGIPDLQVNLGLEWDTPFLPGLTLAGRMIYTGAQYYDPENTQSIPEWTRFDLGARYQFEIHGTPTTFRFNVQNVFDSNYWATASTNSASNYGLNMGAPRTFLLSTSFNF